MAEKRRKKLSKKVYSTGISTHQNLLECLELGISGRSSVGLVKDPTRAQCQHDLNLSEVRDLLLSLLSDDAPPKFFAVKNKPFIRHVVFVYLADCDDDDALAAAVAELNNSAGSPVACMANVRLSKNGEEICLLPHKLLSIEVEVEGAGVADGAVEAAEGLDAALAAGRRVSERYRALLPYVAHEAALRTWCFPLPPISADPKAAAGAAVAATTGTSTAVESAELASSSASADPKAAAAGAAGGDNNNAVDTVAVACVSGTVAAEESAEPSSKRQRTDPDCASTNASESGEAIRFLAGCPRVTVQIGNEVLPDFIETLPLPPLTAPSGAGLNTAPGYGVLGLDCEMVLTDAGDELARVSAVDEFGSVVLDLFVRPSRPVLDYRTQWSGVTASHLEGVTRTLDDVRHLLLSRHLFAPTLLVGHSLENDLRCLRLVHRRCVDTAILFPHPRGFPLRNKLRYLASEHLQLSIQQDGGAGHDSLEDASAAMKLALLKAEKGASFGTHQNKRYADRSNANIICVEHTGGGNQQYQRVPLVAASFQQRGAPVGFFCHSAKEACEYLPHCMPQGGVKKFPAAEGAVGYTSRTAGYDVVGADADAEAEAAKLQLLTEFLTVQLSGPAAKSADANADVGPVEQNLRRTFAYLSAPFDGREGLQRLLDGLRNVYHSHPLIPKHAADSPGSNGGGRGPTAAAEGEAGRVDGVPAPTSAARVQTNTLVVVGRQGNLRPIIDLANQKRVCMKAQHSGASTTLGWTREKETNLKERIKLNNAGGQCAFWVM